MDEAIPGFVLIEECYVWNIFAKKIHFYRKGEKYYHIFVQIHFDYYEHVDILHV